MSCNKSSCILDQSSKAIISKYFLRKSNMDDSLNQFQEPKKKCKGPKQVQTKACKTKQSRKKIKGQKDIRKALQPKRNELISYTKDFNEICKQSGIDVDSQQLQLAVAMSLQEANSVFSPNSRSMTTQERCSKIRTTLLEYGFKVPDVKIKSLQVKRSRGRKRNSMLFKTTDDERQQLIADKFSQILFSCNNDVSKLNTFVNLSNSESYLFDICTKQSYDFLRNDTVYYVEGLFDVSDSKVSNLLRDWSQIPGRPESPASMETVSLSFTEVAYSQAELDVICSGKLTESREIIKNKQTNISNELSSNKKNIEANVSFGVNKSCRKLSFIDNEGIACNSEEVEDKLEANFISNTIENEMDLINDKSMCNKNVLECTYVRGHSPDIFDDDMSVTEYMNRPKNYDLKVSVKIAESDQTESPLPSQTCAPSLKFVNMESDQNTVSSLHLHQTNFLNHSPKKSDEVMDLTECVHNELSSISSQKQNLLTNITNAGDITSSQKSYGYSSTNNKFDNYMDITECVNTASSQNLLIIGENIDLTQDCKYSGEDNELKETDYGQKIDVTVDLTQSSNSNDITLPYVDIYNCADKDVKDTPYNKIKVSTADLEDDNVRKSTNNVSIFEEYNYCHSDISELKTSDDNLSRKSSTEQIANASLSQVVDTENYVDLTQPSTPPENFYNDRTKNDNVCSIDNLGIRTFGEQGDIMTVDYDEVNFSKIEHLSNSCDKSKHSTFEDYIRDQNDNNHESSKESLNDKTEMGVKLEKIGSQLSLSERSNVFVISDEELDYSMHMSKCNKSNNNVEIDDYMPHDNFDFGGISILDEISGIQKNTNSSFRNTSDIKSKLVFNRSISDSYLPAVEIKGTKVKIKSPIKLCKSQGSTPVKNVKESLVSVETPKCNGYLIKTTNITPMLDYESLSTPERNQELEKYGVKPFKRKRAIQLLQHLYNQTHPIVENVVSADEAKGPSKRLKFSPSLNIPTTSKVDLITSSSSNDLKDVCSQNGDIYEVTNVVPDIREVPCCPEDWVFQKKEKAKVHSCRVPLHIAFHNYVSCRVKIRESLLRYDPIHIDIVHAQMSSDGHKYDPKELLKFMDKKCITVKTTDNNVRNTRISKKKS